MKYLILAAIAVIALGGQAAAENNGQSHIQVQDIYAYPTKASMPAAAIFMEVINKSKHDDRLIAVMMNHVERLELHTMTLDKDIMRMRKVEALNVPAQSTLSMAPGGHHVMVFGLEEDWNAGDDKDVTLVFEKAGKIDANMHVISRDQNMHDGHHGHHH